MVDESFHLTPLDVRRYDFGSALRGYDKARVDQFRDQVAEELQRLAQLAQDLESKAKGFHEQLRAFRDRDKALNEALVSAQQLRGEIREQAEREAQLVVREARAEGDRLVDEARSEIRRLQAEVDSLERTRRSHLAQLRALAQRQLTEVDAAEQAVLSESVQAPALPPAPSAPATSAPVASAPVAPPSAPVVAAPPAPARPSKSVAAANRAPAPPPPAAPPAPVVAPAPPAEPAPPVRDDRKSGSRNMTPLWLDSSVPE